MLIQCHDMLKTHKKFNIVNSKVVIIHSIALLYVSVKAYVLIIVQKTICMRDRPEMIMVLLLK